MKKMHELLQRLNDYIGETKPREKKVITDQEIEKKIEKIGSLKKSEQIKLIRDLVHQWIEYDQVRIKATFNKFTGLSSPQIEQMDSETKKCVSDKIKEVLTPLWFHSSSIPYFFKHGIITQKDRVKKITEGHHPSRIIYVTPHEERELFQHFKNITTLLFDDYLGLASSNFEEQVLQNILAIIGNDKSSKSCSFDKITEKKLISFFGSEKIESLKTISYQWFQSLNKDILLKHYHARHHIKYIGERLFLLNEEQIKRYQEKFISYLEKDFSLIEKTRNKTEARKIREDLQEVLSWTS